MGSLLRRLARRCEAHDRPSQPRIRDLEQQLGIDPSATPDDPVAAYTDPALIECGHRWCQRRR
ncbi:hypothetical protein [Streptomyces litmocidini]|uniref:hypothetical protein n=1 Tax=Streptomyces litmocidini TaxID=67318 RepID=UPI00167D4D41|nr:hypothetical protein [Streptomyces litmocidini]